MWISAPLMLSWYAKRRVFSDALVPILGWALFRMLFGSFQAYQKSLWFLSTFFFLLHLQQFKRFFFFLYGNSNRKIQNNYLIATPSFFLV